jgi:hypothetical protein
LAFKRKFAKLIKEIPYGSKEKPRLFQGTTVAQEADHEDESSHGYEDITQLFYHNSV